MLTGYKLDIVQQADPLSKESYQMSINEIPKSESFEVGNRFLSQMKLRKKLSLLDISQACFIHYHTRNQTRTERIRQ
jgi:hypothetical protein